MKKRPPTVDELSAGLSPLFENAGAEALQSKLIDAFESALLEGISPSEALAVILEWVSTELHRVRVDQNSEPGNNGGAQPLT